MLSLQAPSEFVSAIANARFRERHLALAGAGTDFATGSRWHSFASANRLLRAATMLKSGNIVLPFGAALSFKSLAMLVGDLRALGNDGLRIIVRERGRTLRLAQSAALIDLGVSLILPKGLETSGVRLKILSLVGTRYFAHYRRDVEAVISQLSIANSFQRMTCESFRFFVHNALDHESDSVPHTLVVLHPLTAREGRKIDASLALGMRDAVYTVHAEAIYLLLMACKPLDGQPVLERLIGPEFESLLVGWRKIGKRADILNVIDTMNNNIDEVELQMA